MCRLLICPTERKKEQCQFHDPVAASSQIPRPCALLALLTPTRSRLLFPLSLWMVSLVSLRFISHLTSLSSFCLSYSPGSDHSLYPKAQCLRRLYNGFFPYQPSPFFPETGDVRSLFTLPGHSCPTSMGLNVDPSTFGLPRPH